MEEIVVITPCRTAEELLAQLSPQHEFWQPDPPAWIFRGHGRAEWDLLAAAHRKTVGEIYRPWGLDLTEAPNARDPSTARGRAEGELLRSFRRALDEAGLDIPSETADSFGFTEITVLDEVPLEKLPLLALAQHLGLPTGLLDWTRISTKAAYFAAVDREQGEECDLAIWAVRVVHIDGVATHEMKNVSFVTAPLSSNPNLHAQSGVFTRAGGREIPTVDEYVRWQYKERIDPPLGTPSFRLPPPLPWMRKLTLPRSQARRLLRLLSYAGINGSSMFPGHVGVVKRLQEEAYWKSDLAFVAG